MYIYVVVVDEFEPGLSTMLRGRTMPCGKGSLPLRQLGHVRLLENPVQ
jgi:hypothetical protein